VFLDESGFMLTPAVRRTFAPRGQTPILTSWDRHDRISAISAVTVSPKRRRLGLYFHLMPDDENVYGEDTVTFLRQLRRHIHGQMTILWDRGNVLDRSKFVRAYLANRPEIVTEKFPGYAPETNPDEMVWQHLKNVQMAKVCSPDLDTHRRELQNAMRRLELKRHHFTSLSSEASISISTAS